MSRENSDSDDDVVVMGVLLCLHLRQSRRRREKEKQRLRIQRRLQRRTIRPLPFRAFKPITPTTATQISAHVTPALSETSQSTATTSLDEVYADVMATNDEKLLNLLSNMVTLSTEEKKKLTPIEELMDGLTKIIITFPMKDQLDMTNCISQMVHERALEIEMRRSKSK